MIAYALLGLSVVLLLIMTRLSRVIDDIWTRYVLTPCGLSSPVKLHYSKDVKLSLLSLLHECPTLKQSYTPTLYFLGGHLPTLFSAFADFSQTDKIDYERHYIAVPDGGTLSLDFAPPFAIAPHDNRPVVVICHGLTGGSHESYVRSLLAELIPKGWRALVIQFRGCGAPSMLTSPQLYSGAYTDDARCGLLYLSHLLPDAPVYGCGFSLGANVITKLLGQDGSKTTIKAVCPISNPWDFWQGHLSLEASFMGLVYSRAMAKNLRRIVKKYEHVLKDDSRLPWDCIFSHPWQTLYQFDNELTARLGGFKSVEDYYLHASSANELHNVSVPMLAFHSEVDAITSPKSIPYEVFETNPNLALATTKHGGHLGWFEGNFLTAWYTKKRWISKPIVEFLCAAHAADPSPRSHSTAPECKRRPQVGDEMVFDTMNSNVGFKLMSYANYVEGGAVDLPKEKSLLSKGL